MHGVFVSPTLLGVLGHQGGVVNYDRVKKDVVTALKQDRGVYCTTLFDLYGLGAGFASLVPNHNLLGRERATALEAAFSRAVSQDIPTLRPDVRFIPYVQVYEFEALLLVII
jgi:hypothetical protein